MSSFEDVDGGGGGGFGLHIVAFVAACRFASIGCISSEPSAARFAGAEVSSQRAED
jgi:hypothetical protein